MSIVASPVTGKLVVAPVRVPFGVEPLNCIVHWPGTSNGIPAA